MKYDTKYKNHPFKNFKKETLFYLKQNISAKHHLMQEGNLESDVRSIP